MEGLDFYAHGPRKRFEDTTGQILASIQHLIGTARIVKHDNDLNLKLEVNDDHYNTNFQLEGEKYYDYMYFDMEEIHFFSTNKEYILFKGIAVIAKRQWPQELLAMKVGADLSRVAFIQADTTIISCSMDRSNGKLLNLFSCQLDSVPDNIPVTWGSRSKNIKQTIKLRSSTYIAEGDPTITWTESGEFFAVNTMWEGARHILVLTKQCQLLHKSESEAFPGLERLICFRPDGIFLGCVLSEDGIRQELVLVQKNLEVLYCYNLEPVKVQKIEWSPCSEILGVYQKDDEKEWIDLYMISSTKFYLKKRLPFYPEQPLISFRFKDSLQCCYVLELSLKNYSFQYSFLKKIIKSDITSDGLNFTCEVDGNTVDMYVYSQAILPPRSPDTRTKIKMDHCISDILFDAFRPRFAIIDIKNRVKLFKSDDSECELIEEFSLDTEGVIFPITYYRFFFKPNGKFCVIKLGTDSGDLEQDSIATYSGRQFRAVTPGQNCRRSIVKGQVVIRGKTGTRERSEYRLVLQDLSPIADYGLFRFKKEYSVKRFSHGDISINDSKLPIQITSIHFTQTHILITKNKGDQDIVNDYLIAVELIESNLSKLNLGLLEILESSYTRPIEKGAILLNDIPKTSMVVMLLPRGNTECIFLRNISLKMLNDMMVAKTFNDAFKLIKFESLGLNLIVDVNPSHFRYNFEEIISTLHETSLLFKFIMELTNDSSLSAEDRKVLDPRPMKNKRYDICNSIVEYLMSRENTLDYLPEIAMAALCCQPEGYNSIKFVDVITTIIGDEIDIHKNRIVSAVTSLQPYISFEAQYTAALEIYNLDLALIIAERSEMDPQVYRPYINKLKSVPQAHARQLLALKYNKISEAALYCIERFEDDKISLDELIKFAVEYNCFDTIYISLSSRPYVPQQVVTNYAHQLQNQLRFREAGVVLNSNHLYRDAVIAFMRGMHWEDALTAVYNIPQLANQQRLLEFRRIAKTLAEENHFKESAIVYHNYCSDTENALRCYIKGKEYRCAYMLMMQAQRASISEIMVPIIKTSMAEDFELLEKNHETYKENYEKLVDLRKKKIVEEDIQEHAIDTFSDTGSMRSSFRSGSSRASSKKKSKEDRKTLSTKEGSKYEDIGIMRLLYNLAEEACEIMKGIEDQSCVIDIITSTRETIYTNTILRKIFDYKSELLETADVIWPAALKRFEVKYQEDAQFINISELDIKYRTRPDVLATIRAKSY